MHDALIFTIAPAFCFPSSLLTVCGPHLVHLLPLGCPSPPFPFRGLPLSSRGVLNIFFLTFQPSFVHCKCMRWGREWLFFFSFCTCLKQKRAMNKFSETVTFACFGEIQFTNKPCLFRTITFVCILGTLGIYLGGRE